LQGLKDNIGGKKLVLFKGELCHVSEGAGSAWMLQVSVSGLLYETREAELQKKNGL
jgi:hypothetical protein